MSEPSELIDLSKIEAMRLTRETMVFVQFGSGITKTYEFKESEVAALLTRAFVNWQIKERDNSLFIIFERYLYGVQA